MFAILVEFTFLAGAVRVLYLDREQSCEDPESEITIFFESVTIERIRFCLGILLALHILNVIRLIYKMCVRTNSKFKGKQGCCKCIIVDSYCCLGTLAYSYTQITHALDWNDCAGNKDTGNREMQDTNKWLSIEFIY